MRSLTNVELDSGVPFVIVLFSMTKSGSILSGSILESGSLFSPCKRVTKA